MAEGGMIYLLYIVLFVISCSYVDGLKRCFECRSRANTGDCGDPFRSNHTNAVSAVTVANCHSGWCGKIIDGKDELTKATQRLCITNPPTDNEERCAEAQQGSKTVYMCVCNGDLCNGASNLKSSILFIVVICIVMNMFLKS